MCWGRSRLRRWMIVSDVDIAKNHVPKLVFQRGMRCMLGLLVVVGASMHDGEKLLASEQTAQKCF